MPRILPFSRIGYIRAGRESAFGFLLNHLGRVSRAMRVALATMDVWSLASLWVGRADPMSRAAAIPTRDDIRNVAIVAHIDHHNTTLVDACFGSCENQDVAERVNANRPCD
jgi:hypothetical protein